MLMLIVASIEERQMLTVEVVVFRVFGGVNYLDVRATMKLNCPVGAINNVALIWVIFKNIFLVAISGLLVALHLSVATYFVSWQNKPF